METLLETTMELFWNPYRTPYFSEIPHQEPSIFAGRGEARELTEERAPGEHGEAIP